MQTRPDRAPLLFSPRKLMAFLYVEQFLLREPLKNGERTSAGFPSLFSKFFKFRNLIPISIKVGAIEKLLAPRKGTKYPVRNTALNSAKIYDII